MEVITGPNHTLRGVMMRSRRVVCLNMWKVGEICILREAQDENITDELNKGKSTSGGDDTPVDEVKVLERSLGQRRGHEAKTLALSTIPDLKQIKKKIKIKRKRKMKMKMKVIR
ncbi:hypothetical protein R6Q57_026771 [Mikania cordata]